MAAMIFMAQRTLRVQAKALRDDTVLGGRQASPPYAAPRRRGKTQVLVGGWTKTCVVGLGEVKVREKSLNRRARS